MSVRGRLAGLLALAAVGCSVDQLVGLSADGGTTEEQACADVCQCPEGQPSCGYVCGNQVCSISGCLGLGDCQGTCDGGVCRFSCEAPLDCNPTCSAGPCTPDCTHGERVSCSFSCTPSQACAIHCSETACTVVCGELQPARGCDGGVYTCSAACP